VAPGQCEMIVGFLTPHRCPHGAVAACKKCGRRFCEEHLSLQPDGLLCTACQQGLDRPVAVAQVARTFDEADLVAFAAVGAFDQSETGAEDMFSPLS